MEARSVDTIPRGPEWHYEPKWDGFRCLPSRRWSTERSAQWCPLKPKLVVEVAYDHFSGERFRHGTSILRWRPDKAPGQCTFDQLKQKAADPMKLLA
jgi:ATP-dependent DNA ligase